MTARSAARRSAAPATGSRPPAPHAGDDAGKAGAEDETDLDFSCLTRLVGYASTRASIRMRKVFAEHLGALQLKVVDFSILVLVAANPSLNQKQLGAALDLSAPNLAVLLDRLAERGLIERVRSTVDRRAQQLHLTPAGHELTARAETIASTMEADALRMLSTAEQALLIELLLKVARAGPARR